jgi:hypothetical protein
VHYKFIAFIATREDQVLRDGCEPIKIQRR